MQDWNNALDSAHYVSTVILEQARARLRAVREPRWEPTPMPIRYYPTADEVLHPEPYNAEYPTILKDRLMTPNHLGDEVFFYDYCLRNGGPPTSGMYP